MFYLDILQYQWMWFAVLGGAVLLLVTVLTYLAFWQERAGEVDEQVIAANVQPGVYAWLRAFVPWLLIVTVLLVTIYAVLYFVMAALHPPNW